MSDKQYVIVTTISHYRISYAIPLEDLNAETEQQAVDKATELVLDCSVNEMSQFHISEDVVNSEVVDEATLLARFTADNDYSEHWTDEDKLNIVRDWEM